MSQSEVDLTQVFQRMRQAVDQLSQAWVSVAREMAESLPEPVKAERPGRFEHTDDDGDQAVVGEHHLSGWLRMSVNSSVALLSPGAVNRLAQYLDQHRTDQQDCDAELAEQCGRSLRADAAAIDDTPSARCTCLHHSHHQPYGPVCLASGCYCRGEHGVLDADTNGAPEPGEHWCGRNSDHPGHEYVPGVGRTQSVRCLGVVYGAYGS